MMDEMEQEIRNLLADQLRLSRCYGLDKKVRSGFDENPRTLAAIAVIAQILRAQVTPPQSK